MKEVKNQSGVETFIRQTLGCNCPDDVFKTILSEYFSHPQFPGESLQRIVVGNRLLIYIIRLPSDSTDRDNLLSTLAVSGKQEREANSYNRIRLVMLSDNPAVDTPPTQLFFSTLTCIDDRMHVHVIETRECSDLT
jgi:hypothetical protein